MEPQVSVASVARWLGILVVVFVALLVVGGVAVRFHDGPLALVAGSPLDAGEMLPSAGVDWSFIPEIQEIELQLLEPPRSRTVWIVRIAGTRYPFRLTRVKDPESYRKVSARISEKYGLGSGVDPDPQGTWFFKLTARS